jgi:hypothetical protein
MQRVLGDMVDLFDRNLIDLVEHIKALDVFSVALDHVNELVNSVVSPDGHVGIVDLIFMENKLA